MAQSPVNLFAKGDFDHGGEPSPGGEVTDFDEELARSFETYLRTAEDLAVKEEAQRITPVHVARALLGDSSLATIIHRGDRHLRDKLRDVLDFETRESIDPPVESQQPLSLKLLPLKYVDYEPVIEQCIRGSQDAGATRRAVKLLLCLVNSNPQTLDWLRSAIEPALMLARLDDYLAASDEEQ